MVLFDQTWYRWMWIGSKAEWQSQATSSLGRSCSRSRAQGSMQSYGHMSPTTWLHTLMSEGSTTRKLPPGSYARRLRRCPAQTRRWRGIRGSSMTTTRMLAPLCEHIWIELVLVLLPGVMSMPKLLWYLSLSNLSGF